MAPDQRAGSGDSPLSGCVRPRGRAARDGRPCAGPSGRHRGSGGVVPPRQHSRRGWAHGPTRNAARGSLSFEPKWDGFRSIVSRDGREVEFGSRNERPLTRYFPELVEAAIQSLPERCVMDGEIVIPDAGRRRLDFEALLQRIHPADSRVRLLAEQTPAEFVAFDLLALANADYMETEFSERRAVLEQALIDAGPRFHLTPATQDREVANQWFSQLEGAGLDGVIAKPLDGIYEPDKRVMFKVKHERTADCVVAGYRLHKSGPDAIGSLLLGLHNEDGRLASVGVIGALPLATRRELFTELPPRSTPLVGHPLNSARPQPGLR